ncbi:DUF4400 domain-containing protein [Burkholderia multivorans]|nr:DUF4400 domain-containing protein [Burkholderia multivorans]MCO1451131.1 DUF4400 domain-containing protein [Burkholderia multivorans]
MLTLPLFLLAAFVGLIDGWSPRHPQVRRGRESGFVYHRAKAAFDAAGDVAVGDLPGVAGFLAPIGDLLPSAAMLGVATNIAASSFKKYL